MKLSPRQKQVLELIAEGYPKKQIAEQLNVSVTTVITHAQDAYKHLGAFNASHAVAKAIRSGVIK